MMSLPNVSVFIMIKLTSFIGLMMSLPVLLVSEMDSLGLDQQQRLSELVRASENLERLAKSPDRLTYLSAKLSTSEVVLTYI